mmetsp:Transcript_28160/g.38719  ORF Transcript_28160/g.38719 Transcript_28160/m.38719 type:complete len:459 (+) Transcript_28160:689-2065(+)
MSLFEIPEDAPLPPLPAKFSDILKPLPTVNSTLPEPNSSQPLNKNETLQQSSSVIEEDAVQESPSFQDDNKRQDEQNSSVEVLPKEDVKDEEEKVPLEIQQSEEDEYEDDDNVDKIESPPEEPANKNSLSTTTEDKSPEIMEETAAQDVSENNKADEEVLLLEKDGEPEKGSSTDQQPIAAIEQPVVEDINPVEEQVISEKEDEPAVVVKPERAEAEAVHETIADNQPALSEVPVVEETISDGEKVTLEKPSNEIAVEAEESIASKQPVEETIAGDIVNEGDTADLMEDPEAANDQPQEEKVHYNVQLSKCIVKLRDNPTSMNHFRLAVTYSSSLPPWSTFTTLLDPSSLLPGLQSLLEWDCKQQQSPGSMDFIATAADLSTGVFQLTLQQQQEDDNSNYKNIAEASTSLAARVSISSGDSVEEAPQQVHELKIPLADVDKAVGEATVLFSMSAIYVK